MMASVKHIEVLACAGGKVAELAHLLHVVGMKSLVGQLHEGCS
jgi:hypothetical protein